MIHGREGSQGEYQDSGVVKAYTKLPTHWELVDAAGHDQPTDQQADGGSSELQGWSDPWDAEREPWQTSLKDQASKIRQGHGAWDDDWSARWSTWNSGWPRLSA